ncbi:transmembrane Fragile-X-F protein [Lysinibacillus sp. RC79]|uniref:transmembrane Fragile-X-F protein n=1 Tax=Lysinibacillus sp. RC79 TaxID=3156296 RepID=UPI003511D22F
MTKILYLMVLTIVLIVLKLTDVIAWSWWLVLLPAIISFSIYALILVMKLVMVMIAVVAVKKRKEL